MVKDTVGVWDNRYNCKWYYFIQFNANNINSICDYSKIFCRGKKIEIFQTTILESWCIRY